MGLTIFYNMGTLETFVEDIINDSEQETEEFKELKRILDILDQKTQTKYKIYHTYSDT